jgi:hypothetical protein
VALLVLSVATFAIRRTRSAQHGTMSARVVEELVAVAIRRRRSRSRRAGGQRDPAADLARGLHDHFPEVVDERQAADDGRFLAGELAPVLAASG